ncbi:LrgB family protein [Peribacillus sp. JNUCC 23]|uniref:LrgB family protein n=1 Tax=Peribacillus sp. NPDC096379 TaxID=3364393 RepID=UPI000781E52C
MQQTLFAIIVIVLTITAYVLMNRLYIRFSYPLLLPVLTTTIILIILLTLFHIPYSSYMIGGQWIQSLLGPAVVALAYPLYKQRHIVVSYWFPIISGVFVGLITGMISVLLFARVLGIDQTLILSMLPKSLTTPVALQVSEVLGGIPPMTTVFVMIAGFTGVILGPTFMKRLRINSSLGKGIAFGSASHALGTAKSAEYGEFTLSMSSVSMTLSAILGSIIGPIVAWLITI